MLCDYCSQGVPPTASARDAFRRACRRSAETGKPPFLRQLKIILFSFILGVLCSYRKETLRRVNMKRSVRTIGLFAALATLLSSAPVSAQDFELYIDRDGPRYREEYRPR